MCEVCVCVCVCVCENKTADHNLHAYTIEKMQSAASQRMIASRTEDPCSLSFSVPACISIITMGVGQYKT